MSHTKSNADHLRELINSDSYSKDEALEFIQAMEEELKVAESDNKSLVEELDSRPETTAVFLGLDTLHYRLDKGNLRIQNQLEEWVSEVKQQNVATING